MSTLAAARLFNRLAPSAAQGPMRPQAVLRPAGAADAAAMQAFVDGLGADSRRHRFHGGLGRCSARLAAALVATDGARQRVWLAVVHTGGQERIVGEARFVRDEDFSGTAELAIAIADDWQGRGVADALLRRLLDTARGADLRRLRADVMPCNARMQRFLHRHGFAPSRHETAEGLCYECDLAARRVRPGRWLGEWLQALSGLRALAA